MTWGGETRGMRLCIVALGLGKTAKNFVWLSRSANLTWPLSCSFLSSYREAQKQQRLIGNALFSNDPFRFLVCSRLSFSLCTCRSLFSPVKKKESMNKCDNLRLPLRLIFSLHIATRILIVVFIQDAFHTSVELSTKKRQDYSFQSAWCSMLHHLGNNVRQSFYPLSLARSIMCVWTWDEQGEDVCLNYFQNLPPCFIHTHICSFFS